MLQRARSIFYIGEECSEASNEFGGANAEVSSSRLRPENAVGLRLLMQQPRREGRVVMKSEVKLGVLPESNLNARQNRKSFQQLGFLKACFLCHKELSLQKDVFMYKGEHGFCSAECRRHQMAVDKRSERESASAKQGIRTNHFTRMNARASDRRRIVVAAQLTF